ncbi:MAG: NUDIX hydrolase [Thermotogaceae bacterium]|nr:NUDIX hydrolase [Thermotogaceae bacterium]
MDFTEKKISENLVFDGRIIKVCTDKVCLPNGKEAYREVVKHRGAAAAVPIDEDEIIMVRQFRYPVQEHLLEIPAGKLDSNDENPEWRAKEELMEEIGKYPQRLEYLGYIYTSPGFTTEKIHLYLATDLVDNKRDTDEDEFVEVVRIKFEEALKMVLEGEIVDSKTIAGITRAWHKLKGGF